MHGKVLKAWEDVNNIYLKHNRKMTEIWGIISIKISEHVWQKSQKKLTL